METQQITEIPRQIRAAIEEIVVEKDGEKFIHLGNCRLDFKKQYAFLGFTKSNTKVILGDIYSHGPQGVKYTKRFGKIEVRMTEKVDGTTVKQFTLVTDGWNYSEVVKEIVQ